MKMKYALSALIVTVSCIDLAAVEFPVKPSPIVKTAASEKRCVPTINKVEFREDLTRVYVTLSGIPHTSYRIDSVKLILPSGKSFGFTDIDGIDAKRYFQWEDNGVIAVEIDFPAMKPVGRFQLEFDSPNHQTVFAVYQKKAGKK